MIINKNYINVKLLEKYKKNSISQCKKCLSKELDVTEKTINNLIESKHISFKLLKRISKILELDIKKIFYGGDSYEN